MDDSDICIFYLFWYGWIGLYVVSVIAVLINGYELNIIDMRNIYKGWMAIKYQIIKLLVF